MQCFLRAGSLDDRDWRLDRSVFVGNYTKSKKAEPGSVQRRDPHATADGPYRRLKYGHKDDNTTHVETFDGGARVDGGWR